MSQPGRAHALLSASKAAMWLACPPSARLQDTVEEQRSVYAEEGTLAHELAEVQLRRKLNPCDSKTRAALEKQLKKICKDARCGTEMENAIQFYIEVVEEKFMAAKARSKDAVVLLEERVDYSDWVPEGFGRCDVIIIADGLMDVVDLKYGKGEPVSATGNPQMRLYSLGALAEYEYLYDIQEICATVIQPRLDSISSETLTKEELLAWANEVVRPAAKAAFAGEGEYNPGERQCRWCKVRGNCRARADEQMKALAYEFQDPALLSLEEIGSILFIADQLKVWAEDIRDYALEQAKAGNKVPQWKIVEGRSNRKITDAAAVKDKLLAAGYPETDILKPQELVALGDLEKKVLGKKLFAELLSDYVIKPPGKPTLVPETDKRPEMNSLEAEFENMEEI